MNARLCAAFTITACLLVVGGATTNVSQNDRTKLPQNSTGRVGGSVWYQSANLLQNPDASSSTVSPWSQSGGTGWTVQSGPVTLGSCSMNSSDGSPWFLDNESIFVNGVCVSCGGNKTVTLSQTVHLSVGPGFFHNYTYAFEYGGDAFAEAGRTGYGNQQQYYHSHAGFEVSYRLDFLDSSGLTLATDTSGPIFNSNFGCVLLTTCKPPKYGYRRAVGGNIPMATDSVRFTATVMNKVSACYNASTTGTFKNGFDNLSLVLGFYGSPSASGRFTQGFAPSPIVQVTLTPKPAVNRRPHR